MTHAQAAYGSFLGPHAYLTSYAQTGHSFDGLSETWPTGLCYPPMFNDAGSMAAADIHSLAYLDVHLK